ncbi:MAG: hypothetical protein ACUVXA_05655 [Candidatus Jordarchaeum sp.]|uniref:hypothetical protein n=1 Tax=Candidatus Jordarchaeum sp. TaxID=2823881 RepID=UPI00404A8987
MGVWHFSGLGNSPGALTVPLTYIYLLLKAASRGDEAAQSFFEASGEESQERKGAPEALIIFTSKEIIEEQIMSIDITDKWFGTSKGPLPSVILQYFQKLLGKLRDVSFSEFYREGWIRYVHFVAVNHMNLYDCFPKCYATMNALREKEIWINMVGGSNPINASLILSAGFVEATAKTYYVFESDTSCIHPQFDKSVDFSKPRAELLLSKLNILPFFSLDLGKLVRGLNQKFLERGEKVNIKEIDSLLSELELPRQYIKKLVSGGWVRMERDTATVGDMLERWNSMLGKIGEYPSDYSAWKKWASREGILYNLTLKGSIEKSQAI